MAQNRARYTGAPLPSPPDGTCAVCWERLGWHGLQEWTGDPVAVLQTDIETSTGAARDILGLDLLALTALVAAHRSEFADHLESEQVLLALAGT
jgi:hypothetical protein